MEQETRKASDILLDLESKIDVLLGIVRIQELNIKILSNKINDLINQNGITKLEVKQPSVEAVYNNQNKLTEKQIPIAAEFNLEVEKSPNGFRRTSRPETFDHEQNQEKVSAKKILPKSEIVVPKKQNLNQENTTNNIDENNTSKIQVTQRVVDKTNKSVFLAEVEIINIETGIVISKTRTNGAGKWAASLPLGKYKIVLNKNMSKEKIEVVQNIIVDGSVSKLELQTLIIKG